MKIPLSCAFAFNVHDSSVSFAIGNEVVLVIEAERAFRKKKKSCNREEMEKLISVGLNYLNKAADDVDHWAMTTYINPLIWGEELFQEKTGWPEEPYWVNKRILGKNRNILVINHHLSHAATYLMTHFEQAVITSCDGGGDNNESFAVYRGDGLSIKRYQIPQETITGKTYSAASSFIYGSKWNEGKFMALAAFGEVRDSYLHTLQKIVPEIESSDHYIFR